MIIAALFVLVASLSCAAVVLAIFAVTYVYYLSSSRAITQDGLARGTATPAWSLADSAGRVIRSPPERKPFQLIVFADHSLKSFPSVVEGLHDLVHEAPQLEIVVLMRGPNHLTEPLLRVMGLGEIPVLTGSSALYGQYNVRVLPFAMFVDSGGQVRGSSLVNHAWQLKLLWRLANVVPEPGERPLTARPWRRPARTGA
jgi:hypothetical protein